MAPTYGSLNDKRYGAVPQSAHRYIFQFPSLLPTLRAIDNVALPALLDRHSGTADTYNRAAQLLTEVDWDSHFDAYPSEMSAGEQRRTVIARASSTILFCCLRTSRPRTRC